MLALCSVVSGPGEPVRCARENGSGLRAPSVPGRPADNVACDRHQVMITNIPLYIISAPVDCHNIHS